jgi:hypothetical protein
MIIDTYVLKHLERTVQYDDINCDGGISIPPDNEEIRIKINEIIYFVNALDSYNKEEREALQNKSD